MPAECSRACYACVERVGRASDSRFLGVSGLPRRVLVRGRVCGAGPREGVVGLHLGGTCGYVCEDSAGGSYFCSLHACAQAVLPRTRTASRLSS